MAYTRAQTHIWTNCIAWVVRTVRFLTQHIESELNNSSFPLPISKFIFNAAIRSRTKRLYIRIMKQWCSVLFRGGAVTHSQTSSIILWMYTVSSVNASYKLPPRATGESPANGVNGSAKIFVLRNVPTSSVNPYQTLTSASRPNAHLDKSRRHSSAHIFGFRKVYSVIYDNGFSRTSSLSLIRSPQIYSDFERIKLVFIAI